MGLDEALEYLLDEEGGWSNHPADKGGKTMYGVTQGTYDLFRKRKGRSQQSVAKVTKAEARELYDEEYWRAAYCDKLPWPVSYMTFDAAVNSGPGRSVKWTQAGLGVSADGKVGLGTIAAAEKAVSEGDGKALLAIVDQRVTFLARLVQSQPSQAAFLLGWWRRTLRILGRSLTVEA
jgi:lysozyme family protein